MHKSRNNTNQQQTVKHTYSTIVFIGPEGKETWIGSEEGLRDEYPFAKILKIKNIN